MDQASLYRIRGFLDLGMVAGLKQKVVHHTLKVVRNVYQGVWEGIPPDASCKRREGEIEMIIISSPSLMRLIILFFEKYKFRSH